jgi:rod shape-determining protein MreC
LKRILTETSKIKIVNHLLVLVLAVFGLASKRFDFEEMTVFQKIMAEIVSPMQQGISAGQKSVNDLVDNYLRIVKTNQENHKLKERLSQLENDLFNLEEVRRENFRLKQMLAYSEEISQKKILAQVIGWDSANQFKVLRLNKGSDDGIQIMSPVITHKGLVGYVYRMTRHYADVLTILDSNNRVDVIVERTRTHAIVEGIYNFSCALKYVNKNEPIELGDRLITAGVGGIYPKGIKVGIISSIEKETTGMTLDVEVTPSVDFHKLEEVLVLLPLPTLNAGLEETPPRSDS